MPSEDLDVLICGGSTVGLFSALFLARAGVRATVVERHPAPLAHPRAMGIGPRTVELLRAAGLAAAVDARCMDMSGGDLQMFSTPTLAEADLVALARAAPPRTDQFRHVSPQTLRGTCPQGRLDEVVVEDLRASGARVEFGTVLRRFEQDDAGVTAWLDGPGGERVVRTRYLIAADGARSAVRQALGIDAPGPGTLGDPLISVLFKADLAEFTHGQPFVTCDITTPAAAGGLLPVDGVSEWLYVTRYSPAADQTPADFTSSRCTELIRAAVGSEDLSVDVVSILPWQVHAAVAERFRSGRVFLAGDAAHVIPPVGAFGMNTGVADAHNLAWKLAAVLAGQAGPALLDTYQAERLPVARTALEQSMLRLGDPLLHWATGPAGEQRRSDAGALNAPVVHLGYRYDSAAVVEPVAKLPSTEKIEMCLDGSPGSRLPHLWLTQEGVRVSTLDLVDNRFTLLAGPDGAAWLDVAGAVADRLGVSLGRYVIGGPELAVVDGGWADAMGAGDSGALIVRPDGFVGWRAAALPADPTKTLADAFSRLLARP